MKTFCIFTRYLVKLLYKCHHYNQVRHEKIQRVFYWHCTHVNISLYISLLFIYATPKFNQNIKVKLKLINVTAAIFSTVIQ